MTRTTTKTMIMINITRKDMTTGTEVAEKAAGVAAAVAEAVAAVDTAGEAEEKHLSAIMDLQGCTLCLGMVLLLRQQATVYSR